jgi:hypothetical protein
MFLTSNQPFLNFDNIVDIASLLQLKPYFSAFVANNLHLLKPTKLGSGNFLDPNTLGVNDFHSKFDQAQHSIDDPVLRETLKELYQKDLYGNYLMFEHNIIASPLTMLLRYSKDYTQKHLAEQAIALPHDKNFEFFYTWLDQQDIFEQYGRVCFFVNYPGSASPIHRDWADSDSANSDEFLWLNFGQHKKFFLYEPDVNKKTYITGHANWFNTGNFHGSEPVQYACYTMRVDGVFSDAFRKKANIQ